MIEHKIWVLPTVPVQPQTIADLAQTLGILPPTAQLLYQRGIQTPEQARRFLSLSDLSFSDPYLLRDMDRAVLRIEQALAKKEKITVYGDYDVDGVTATSVLYLYLKERGAQVDYYIPLRLKEGYGMHESAVATLSAQGTKLVVTVDTGITAQEEVKAFSAQGVDVVITDHHACQETLPDAVAVVNPQRPDQTLSFSALAGVGVAFCLISALEQSRAKQAGEDVLCAMRALCDTYLDLVAIGTIADVMPLVEENRLIVKWGLHRIETNPRLGLQALLTACSGEKSKRSVNSALIGFTIAPRINAAGRMGDASKGVELFTCTDPMIAQQIAHELCEQNRTRQAKENEIAHQAFLMIEEEIDLEKESVIVLAKEGWHSGIIGIVASRIAEHYHKPCILISIDGEEGKGSGRSVKGVHLVQALSACEDLLIRYGGHELAAGLTIAKENIPAFRRAFSEYATAHLKAEDLAPSLLVDLELTAAQTTLEQAQQLSLLEPFGTQNPQPVFCLRDATLTQITEIGGGKHSKLLLQCADQVLTALWFGMPADRLEYGVGDTVDVAFTLDVNAFMGTTSLQLLLKDMRHSKTEQQRVAKGIVDYYALSQSAGALLCPAPVYTQFAEVYRTLKQHFGKDGNTLSLHKLCHACLDCTWGQIRFILDVFSELGFFALQPVCQEPLYLSYRIAWNPVEQKVRLENSARYRTLQQRKMKQSPTL